MATLYLRCGTGVSSFVIHSKSSSAYPKTVTATSYTAYTGFAANSTDAYISDIVYKSGYSGATIYSSTTGTEWSAGSDPYISLATYSTRYAEVRATGSSVSYKVSCSSGTGISKFTYLNSTTSGTGTQVTAVSGLNVGSGGYLYLKDFVFTTGYSYPVTVTTSNPSSTWTIDGPSTTAYYRQVDPPSGGGTRSVTLTATQVATQNIWVKCGTGVYSFDIYVNGSFKQTVTATSYTYVLVNKSDAVQVRNVQVVNTRYGTPYYMNYDANDYIYGTDPTAFYEYEAIGTGGVRYITISATQIVRTLTTNFSGSNITSVMYSNGKIASPDDNVLTFSASVTISSVTLSAQGWSGDLFWSNGDYSYKFATVSSGTITYLSTQEPIDYTGSDRTVYLISVRKSYNYQLTFNANGGSGGPGSMSSGNTYDTSWTFTIPNGVPTWAGHEFLGWGINSSSQVASYQPGGTITMRSNQEERTLYAVWQLAHIDLFQWTQNDGVWIVKDQPFSNVTAAKWREMHQKIVQCGHPHVYTEVSSGDIMTSSLFNAAVTDISNLAGCGTLPGSKATGNTIMASYFSANSASLKSALNAAINHYNNN